MYLLLRAILTRIIHSGPPAKGVALESKISVCFLKGLLMKLKIRSAVALFHSARAAGTTSPYIFKAFYNKAYQFSIIHLYGGLGN